MRVFLLVLVLSACSQALAGDDAAGKAKAENCAACHNAMVSLKGRGAETIAAQMKVIRSGEKTHPPGLADLNDEDIAAIAAYLDGAE